MRILLDPDPPAKEGAPPPKPSEDENPTGRMIDDPIMSVLAEDLGIMVKNEDDKPQDPPQAPPIVGAPDKKPDQAAPLKVKIERRQDPRKVAEDVVDRRISEFRAQNPLPPPPVPPEKKETPPPADPPADDLSPEQREELEDATYAAKIDPKFKDQDKRLRQFYADLDRYRNESIKADPDRSFDGDDREFIDWVKKHKPWTREDRDRMRIERLADAKVESKLKEREAVSNERITKAERTANEARVTPAIEKSVATLASELEAETKSEDPLEKDVYANFRQSAVQLGNDYLRVAYGIDPFDEKKDTHNWLIRFVSSQAEIFAKKGGDSRVRDGKTFVTPTQYAEMQKTKDQALGKSWTFTDRDIMKMIKAQAIQTAKAEIKAIEERNAKMGFVRSKSNGAPKPAQDVQPTSGPRVTPSPAPGAGERSDSEDVDHVGRELVQILELK